MRSFGSTSVSFTVDSATQITATVPAHSGPGTVHVTVTTAYGTSSTGSSDEYTYMNMLAFDGEEVEPGEGVEALTTEQANAILDEAVQRWITAAGDAGDEVAQLLANVEVRIVDMPGNLLAGTAGNIIWIDQDAAGYGWFVDVTPSNDSEFDIVHSDHELWADSESPAFGSVDLLTVLGHELGHMLGFDHNEELMNALLGLGVRRLPEYEEV